LSFVPSALSDFAAEANEILEALGRDLLTLDHQRGGEPDPELLNAIFRAAHSLKGLSSMFGVDRMATLAHHLEDALDALRLGKVSLTGELLDALIQGLDGLTATLHDALEARNDPEVLRRAEAVGAFLTRLSQGAQGSATDLLDVAGIEPSLRAVLTEYEEHRLKENIRKGLVVWKVRAAFSLDDFDVRLGQLNSALKALGEVVSTLPSAEPTGDEGIAFDIVFGSDQPLSRIAAAVPQASVTPLANLSTGPQLALESLPPPVPESPPPSAPRDDELVPTISSPTPAPFASDVGGMRAVAQTVRVDINRLDGLMNTVGELLVIRNTLQRLAESARQTTVQPVPKAWSQGLDRETRSLERKLDELQKALLQVRMVPLGQVFDKLARLMRRLVRESGKAAEFHMVGGDVELDKLIVDELSDPLMHLLRNALDHGVELPAARVALGKAKAGRLTLKAQQQGNHVVIEVGDDGAGMDEARIKQVAIERGVIREEQADELDRAELLNLVFLPGFSTRADVSPLSGRGVGLDVVKTNLAKLSGLIDIESSRGAGTRFVLTLPLTLAIIRALLVRSGGELYAVPLNAVLEIVSISTAELRSMERREVMSVRGQTVPFVRLSDVFELEATPPARQFVIVVGLAQQRLGIGVDLLEGQQDIVTKPLGGRLKQVRGIAGAAELGDRRAILVLDVASLVEELVRPNMVAVAGASP
jgi:two-component system, chemotaxis family, sensor kinase CheA